MSIVIASDLRDANAASAFLDVKPQTLAAWRCAGRGPKFVRVGRNVRYRLVDLKEFLDRNTVTPEDSR